MDDVSPTLPPLAGGQDFEPTLNLPCPNPMPLWSDGEEVSETTAWNAQDAQDAEEAAQDVDALSRWWKREPDSNSFTSELAENSVASRTLTMSRDEDKGLLCPSRLAEEDPVLRMRPVSRHTWTTAQVLALCAFGLFSFLGLLHWGFDHGVHFRHASKEELQMMAHHARDSGLLAEAKSVSMASRFIAKGATELEVGDKPGFHVRDKIDIGGYETKFIIGLAHDSTTIILDSPTEYSHLAGTVIARIDHAEAPARSFPGTVVRDDAAAQPQIEIPDELQAAAERLEDEVSGSPVRGAATVGGSDGVAGTAREVALSQQPAGVTPH